MNKISLFLLGLVVAFGVSSCDSCKDGDKTKGDNTIKQGQEKTFQVKFSADADDESIIVAPGFIQDGLKLAEAGIIVAVKKDETKTFKLKAKDDASEGDVVIKVNKSAAEHTPVAEFTLKVVKK